MYKIITFIVIIVFAVFVVLILSNANSNKAGVDTNLALPSQPARPTIVNQPSNTPEAATVASPTSSEPTASVSATIKTSKGDIVLTLYPSDAPNTVKNFISKANSGFYNNLTFHRVEDWVIQGGDPKGDGTGGGNMATELNNRSFTVGALGVARGGDIKVSNDSQFFITKKDATWLDKQYTNFGTVTKGMDVVNNIQIGDKILGITIAQ